jgi:hypothetical protein
VLLRPAGGVRPALGRAIFLSFFSIGSPCFFQSERPDMFQLLSGFSSLIPEDLRHAFVRGKLASRLDRCTTILSQMSRKSEKKYLRATQALHEVVDESKSRGIVVGPETESRPRFSNSSDCLEIKKRI